MNAAERFNQLTCNLEIRNNLRASSVRAAAFTWAASAADSVLRLGSTAILARLILPEHFGLVMMVTAITTIADQFRDLGLSTATVQRKEITHQEITNLFWVNAAAGVLIALIVCAAAPLLSAYYKEPRLGVITCVLATIFVWGGLMVQHQALLARTLRLGRSATVRLLASGISTVLAIWLAWKGFGYWALVWREIVRAVLLTVGMWISLPWIPGVPYRETNIRPLLGFGAHLSAANIVVCIATSLDRILIGRLWGAVPVALYRQAYQLLVVPMDQFLSPMFNVTQPGLSMLQDDDLRYRRFYEKVLKLVCLVTMPISLFVATNAAEITRVVLGRGWLECTEVLRILSISTFLKSPIGWSSIVLMTRGRSKRYLALTMIQNATLILSMLIGVHWGITGVAWADVLATCLAAPVTLYLAFKDSPVTFRSFSSATARPVAASLIMAIGLGILHETVPSVGAIPYLTLSGLFALATFAGAWLLLPGGTSDLKELRTDASAFRQWLVDRGIKSRQLPPIKTAPVT